ncbi:hypothetical protein FB45DRAFT_1032036 [Roridomyces roridus]|uniref:HEAT repeat domain-containing protein n=1 Tax=Roridomyces roridus TaxID=1738132 RepID=A0AAD7BIS8_9AGAR|nr:hypothetical protein FB45DRAFT_1032036 [Roridomyces roridus]
MRENSVKELCAGFAGKHHSLALSILLDQIPMKNWLDDLRNMDQALVEQTICKLVRISRDPAGPAAMRVAGIQHYFPELLSSKSASIRSRTCDLVDNLPGCHTWAPDMLPTLHELLEDDSEAAPIGLAYALNQMTEHFQPVGARIFEVMNTVETGPSHWRCDPETCSELEPVITDVLGTLPIQRLLDLTKPVPFFFLGKSNPMHESISPYIMNRSQDAETLKTVAETMAQLSWWPAGGDALVAARYRYPLFSFLTSTIPEVRQSACIIFENLGFLDEPFYEPLLSLVHDTDTLTCYRAVCALAEVSRWPDHVPASEQTSILATLDELQGDLGRLNDKMAGRIAAIRANFNGERKW